MKTEPSSSSSSLSSEIPFSSINRRSTPIQTKETITGHDHHHPIMSSASCSVKAPADAPKNFKTTIAAFTLHIHRFILTVLPQKWKGLTKKRKEHIIIMAITMLMVFWVVVTSSMFNTGSKVAAPTPAPATVATVTSSAPAAPVAPVAKVAKTVDVVKVDKKINTASVGYHTPTQDRGVCDDIVAYRFEGSPQKDCEHWAKEGKTVLKCKRIDRNKTPPHQPVAYYCPSACNDECRNDRERSVAATATTAAADADADADATTTVVDDANKLPPHLRHKKM